jgi:tetratricopeptide (TPR) repeat protein
MAIVYLARDLRHDRDVAVKVLRPEFGMAVSAERFLREIHLEAQLKHPYILPLFDSGDADGLPYYVMPHVRGGSLRARLNEETQLPLEEALRITSEVAEALSYAHAHGVVHRDVKPGNILLDESHALLSDFGIARAITEVGGSALSSSGLIVGTPEYMSPEQGSQHARLDGRSDVYALGCVLYEMLSGEPPFTGPTAQAIIARHMQERPRSLRVVRSTIPEHIEDAIQTALAKVPADRYATAERFVAALGAEGEVATAAGLARGARQRYLRWGAGVAGAVALVASLGVWRAHVPASRFDQNKVVLFPLTERAVAAPDRGVGYDVAVMLSAALEHAQPLRWIDGAQRLGEPGIANLQIVPSKELRRVATSQRAGYYIDGAVVGGGADSTTVVLRLHDTRGDSVVAQESATGLRDSVSAVQLGLAAVTRLLPVLVDPGRSIDLSPLSARKASATALWIQGEREYRRSRFQRALDFYQRAVGEDSAMAFAALKGAQAANWLNRGEEAQKLVVAALARESSLPAKHRALAHGLKEYWAGRADTAITWVNRALAMDPEWAEGHMVLGEVYYHLLPEVRLSLDSLAQLEFSQAAGFDSGFAPPLFHLAEMALRASNVNAAGALIDRFRSFDPDTARWRQLAMMRDCVSGDLAYVDWNKEAAAHPMDVLQAARSLAVGGAQLGCADRGFTALFTNPELPELRWAAFLGLHGIAMAQRRFREIVPLVDAAVAAGVGRAPALYFVDVLLGAPLESKALETDSIWRSLYGRNYDSVSVATRLVVAQWLAHRRDTLRLIELWPVALADTDAVHLPLQAVLDGHMALARGDTGRAVRQFSDLRVEASAGSLEWGLIEPLPIERLVLAKAALEHGNFQQADQLARVFDHPSPVAFLPFIPLGLAIRLRSAQAMGHQDLVARYQYRLRQLQGPDVTALGL